MRESQICNHSKSNFHIFMTNIISDLLYDELRVEKWLWSSLNHLIICFKHHSADFETATQLKKNKQEENYSWHLTSIHVWVS